MISIKEFCDLHGACKDGMKWAVANCSDMADVWSKLRPDWLIWVATREGVLTDKELRLFAVFCARQVEHLTTDQRSKDAIDTAERHANGEATDEELAAALAAAWDAARDAAMAAAWDAAMAAVWAAALAAARAAARDAAMAAVWAAALAAARAAARDAASCAAWDAALAAAWDAQSNWLRKNTKPNFEVTE